MKFNIKNHVLYQRNQRYKDNKNKENNKYQKHDEKALIINMYAYFR